MQVLEDAYPQSFGGRGLTPDGSSWRKWLRGSGGREGIRTLGLLVANEEKSEIRHGAAIT
jgi:hypothetical protein